MSERKVNLEEILSKHLAKMLNITSESFKDIEEMKKLPEWQTCIEAMKEACRQTIELAAENSEFYSWNNQDELKNIEEINKQSILNTINQIE